MGEPVADPFGKVMHIQERSYRHSDLQHMRPLERGAAAAKSDDIVDVAAASAAKAYSASYKDALSKGADEKSARTTAYQARQEAHKQAVADTLKGAAKSPGDAHAAFSASDEAKLAAKPGAKPALDTSRFSPETKAKLSEIQGRIADLKAKTASVKAGAATTREQHAERLKAFAEKAKAPHPLEKRVAELKQKLEQTQAQTRKIDQGIARRERAEDHGPLQSGLKGGKFYVTRSGAKKYIK
jgi:DNA repair exonuclease SbcCD ATPase subunit